MTFFVPGQPKGKPAPKARALSAGGRTIAQVYKTKKSRVYEEFVASCVAEGMKRGGMHYKPLLEGPVALQIRAYLQRPKGRPKREQWPDRKPDLSNIVKAIEDGMTLAGVWCDDKQVCSLDVVKSYASGGQEPGVWIELRPM